MNKKLSSKMEEVYNILKLKNIERVGEYFWTYVGCKKNKKGFPDWVCETSTLRALAKREMINLDEEKGIAMLRGEISG